MKHFSIRELIHSREATKRNIDNSAPPNIKVSISRLITDILDPVRTAWGSPITVNSGYRSPVLNKIVGGVPSSQHQQGEAADITVGSKAQNKKLFNLIVKMMEKGEITVGQLINEKDYSWIHVSLPTARLNNQIKHL